MHRPRPQVKANQPYLKLINRRDQLDFKVDESYPLGELVTIGRSARNDIILRDPYISGEHARISHIDGSYFLEDLDSTNGTFVNGEKINKPLILKNGDKISFRQVEYLFVLQK
ncbi:MAG: FHA domain-containing protein [Desulfitobacteriaceae bacterium]|nr:FHA domain-containing protein [Desulfitobacteriaceae bacterium]MDD4752889.1 FHA domain-containing protein [Desulfitobacteriaceae bacterium]